MPHRIAAKITGVAGYLPPKVLTNADLEKMIDTSDEWIRTRTGIRERHIVEAGSATSHMATEAAKQLLKQTNTDPAEIDLIVLASVTPDMFFRRPRAWCRTASGQKMRGDLICRQRVRGLRTR